MRSPNNIHSHRTDTTVLLHATTTLLSLLYYLPGAAGWGSSGTDPTLYGNALSRDWLYESKSISMQYEGCVWGYVSDNEDAGCMEDSSEDGTTYWYQMANCRRAQAVYSLYGSSSSSTSCSSSNFKESFVTTDGVGEFIYYLSQYDPNNPFGDNYNAADDDDDYADYDGDNDGGGGGGDYELDDLPVCEGGDNGYIGLGCSDDGTFSLQYFEDAYCQEPTGQTYDQLKTLNNAMKTYKNCAGIYYYGDGDEDGSLPSYLISASMSCSSVDSGYCTDTSAMKERNSHTGSKLPMSTTFAGKSWVTKLKYVTGAMLLLASFVMFTGILFTNRRRRRALMQRKYRQSRSDRSRKSKSRSKSKSRKSRSRSRAKKEGGEGVLA